MIKCPKEIIVGCHGVSIVAVDLHMMDEVVPVSVARKVKAVMAEDCSEIFFDFGQIDHDWMMKEQAWDDAGRLIHESFNWVHGNSAPRLEVPALMVQVMNVFIHPFSDVWEPSRIPLVLESVYPVEMTISPGRQRQQQSKERKWMLIYVHVIIMEK